MDASGLFQDHASVNSRVPVLFFESINVLLWHPVSWATCFFPPFRVFHLLVLLFVGDLGNGSYEPVTDATLSLTCGCSTAEKKLTTEEIVVIVVIALLALLGLAVMLVIIRWVVNAIRKCGESVGAAYQSGDASLSAGASQSGRAAFPGILRDGSASDTPGGAAGAGTGAFVAKTGAALIPPPPAYSDSEPPAPRADPAKSDSSGIISDGNDSRAASRCVLNMKEVAGSQVLLCINNQTIDSILLLDPSGRTS